MQEVTVITALDALVTEHLSEEEILACLVADSEPLFMVPTKKAKLRESRLQIMEEEEDPLQKYLKENLRLQKASHRLEQENDSLAHRLIVSKVALRTALDQAEDNVDQLSKDLILTQRKLKSTHDQMRGKEEESAMLKEVFRRELEKADLNIERSSGIISDYKQICSQLTERLERQQAAHRQEMDSIKTAVKACSSCSHVLETLETSSEYDQEEDVSPACPLPPQGLQDMGTGRELLREQIRELEQELARTKLQMVEAKCKIQELEHEAGVLNSSLQDARNSWLTKAFTSLRTPSSKEEHRHLKTPAWHVMKIAWPHREHQHDQ